MDTATAPARLPILDCHVHVFAIGDGGCHVAGSKRVAFKLLKRILKLNGVPDAELGRAFVARLLHQLNRIRQRHEQGGPRLDGVVVLGMDGRYDAAGQFDLAHTAYYVPNNYVFDVCRQDARLLPGASINPLRSDAIDELHRVAEAGAVCVKMLPNSQGFDPADARFKRFWQTMARLELPLLSHTGKEHTLPVVDQSFGDPLHLTAALEQGVTVIAAHAGTGGLLPRHETWPEFLEMLPRHPNLYGDISALGCFVRAGYYLPLLERPEVLARMIYGSDYPMVTSPVFFAYPIGLRKSLQLSFRSVLARPLELAVALGVPPAVFTRAAELLRISPEQMSAIERL